MTAERQLLSGFMIGGFRSFHGEPQKILPLGKMNLFAGGNNSGKSNVLLAAQTWLPVLQSVTSATKQLDPLDVPQLRDEAAEVPSLLVGVPLKMSPKEAAAYLLEKNRSAGLRGAPVGDDLEELLAAPQLHEEAFGESFIWLEWELKGSKLIGSDRQLEGLKTRLEQSGKNGTISTIAQRLFQRSGSIRGDLEAVVDALRDAIQVPPVVTIPAIREVKHDESLEHDAWEMSGQGLPRIIQTWQAPTAERHRENRHMYRRLNQFLQDVLEDETAEIGAPFNAHTVHISLKDRTLPLQNLGTGLSQVTLIAAVATVNDDCLLCIEEPELHLHPTLLRKLLLYLRDHTDNQYLISTHSAHMLDSPAVTIFRTSYDVDSGTSVELAGTPSQRAQIAQHLGYRPSDLIQANVVIWVEGPSDRIYLNHWIQTTDPRLVDGVHYSIMFYGGALIAHLRGDDVESFEPYQSDFVSLLRINRNMIMMIDSDKAGADDQLRETKARLAKEFTDNGGLVWITAGREVENYVPLDVFIDAARKVHSKSTIRAEGESDPFGDVFERVGVKGPDKVRIADEAVTAAAGLVWDMLDLRAKVDEVVAYICEANGMQSAKPAHG